MAGILDKKNRIMDSKNTRSARLQAGQGGMRIRYATFTDKHAFYEQSSSIGVAADASERIYFEPFLTTFDQITFEANINGEVQLLRNFPISGTLEEGYWLGAGGEFLSSSVLPVSPIINEFSQQIVQAITASYDAIVPLYTVNTFNDDTQFKLSTGSLYFNYYESVGGTSPLGTKNVGELTPPWRDWHFSHLTNFAYLPPINKLAPGASLEKVIPAIISGYNLKNLNWPWFKEQVAKATQFEWKSLQYDANVFLEGDAATITPQTPGMLGLNDTRDVPISNVVHGGIGGVSLLNLATALESVTAEDFLAARYVYMDTYPRIADVDPVPVTYEQLSQLLESYSVGQLKTNGSLANQVFFDETSNDNNVIIQFFEISNQDNKIRKLANVDFGIFRGQDLTDPDKSVFFIGKFYKDVETHQLKFANLFTLVAE
jgi:hypothetical protein